MGDEFYASIKLVTGEEIFALISVDNNDDDAVIVMQNPVTMKMMNTPNGSMIKVKPWMEIPGDDFYLIKYDKIITMTETKDDKLIHFYNKFLEDSIAENSVHIPTSGEIKPDAKMGYISSVDKSRKKLEDVFKLEIESKES